MLPQTQFRIFILLFVIFGSVSLFLSTCGKYWIHAADVYSGLWETCWKSVADQSGCKDVDTDELCKEILIFVFFQYQDQNFLISVITLVLL